MFAWALQLLARAYVFVPVHPHVYMKPIGKASSASSEGHDYCSSLCLEPDGVLDLCAVNRLDLQRPDFRRDSVAKAWAGRRRAGQGPGGTCL